MKLYYLVLLIFLAVWPVDAQIEAAKVKVLQKELTKLQTAIGNLQSK